MSTMTNRIHQHNANTISHLSQETPLPFKKYTKKRSWVWDWFEQDPDNKYRAVCLFCHQEIFRLDGDRGSPKKLITHVNSKHGINKDNYNDMGHIELRNDKLRNYLNKVGPLVTNRDDAIQLRIMTGTLQGSPDLISQSPPLLAGMDPSQHTVIDTSRSTPSYSNQDATIIAGESRPISFASPPTRNEPKYEPRYEHNHEPIDMNQIDPSLSEYRRTRQDEKKDEIVRYNDLVMNHNRQVEAYNKDVIIKTNGHQKPLFPLVEHGLDEIQLAPEDNESQKALKYFIAENSLSFANLNFLLTPSFENFLNTIRDHPEQKL
ncbi:uncharacterized protein PRCAT00002089001 [Priceomyces carsonii]|uniref:uncharacterized protein n=1 Tax=Priceomyces carsonii TaxID=28549 RepID=UPI002ED7AFA5|nr:unnamed protein product [Priceomyces carsonii]